MLFLKNILKALARSARVGVLFSRKRITCQERKVEGEEREQPTEITPQAPVISEGRFACNAETPWIERVAQN